MFLPWNSTVPSTRASGTVSCIRFRQRSSVDLPHPDGPMIAVTSFCGKESETSRTACVGPKYALSSCVFIAGGADSKLGGGTTAARAAASVIGTTMTRAHGEPREDADHEHEGDEHERSRPRLCVPFVVWADGVHE